MDSADRHSTGGLDSIVRYVRSVVDLPCVSTSINVRRSKFLTSSSRNFSWAQVILCATVV